MILRATVLCSALVASTSARAEAALADLIFLMPSIILAGLYQELSRPWVLAALWGAAAFCWLVSVVAGRDAVGDLLDRMSHTRGPQRFQFSSYGLAAFWAALCSVYVMVGSVLVSPAAPAAKAVAARPATTATPAPKTLAYPHGAHPGNPRGEWPTASGPLPGLSMGAYGGNAYLMLRNPGQDGLWVRLCVADLAPECVARREIYLAPRSQYLMERVAPERYHLAYAQVTGGLRMGTTAAFRVDSKTWDGMREMALTDFQPAARP